MDGKLIIAILTTLGVSEILHALINHYLNKKNKIEVVESLTIDNDKKRWKVLYDAIDLAEEKWKVASTELDNSRMALNKAKQETLLLEMSLHKSHLLSRNLYGMYCGKDYCKTREPYREGTFTQSIEEELNATVLDDEEVLHD